jgi:hypothetical protein
MLLHHQIPTHLNVEDKLLFGLTARQFLTILIGVSLAYSAWNQPAAPASLHLPLAAACLALTFVLALVRPGDRPIEQWALVALIYIARPRASSWSRPEPEPSDWQAPADEGWAEAAPDLAWADGCQP